MGAPTVTARDVEHCRETWRAMLASEEEPDGPETVMISTGYADVWSDGEVTQFGRLIIRRPVTPIPVATVPTGNPALPRWPLSHR